MSSFNGDDMIVVMCCTRNWYPYLITDIYALFKNNDVKKLYLFIEDDEIPYLVDKRIKFININKLPDFIKTTSPNYNTKYSKLALCRTYFSKVLKEDKVIYLDVDAIVVDDISELWDMDMEGNSLIGVKEGGNWDNYLQTYGMNDNYINSGVLVMNLENLRACKLDDSILELLNKRYYAFPDQDAINLICRNRIKYVSNVYNSSETTGIVDDAKIVHYIRGKKGWLKSSPRSEIWYKYHDEILGGKEMEKYKVKTTIGFNDYGGGKIGPNEPFTARKTGDVFECSKERYEYLKSHNVVDLIEVIPEITEAVVEEVKETINKTSKKKKK